MSILSKIDKLSSRAIKVGLFVFGCLLYANTLGHQFAQDDAIVITDNMFTKDGVQGISGHLSNDTFYGFFKKEGKAKLVSGGRYRPLTPIMFSVEHELFGLNPFIGHLMNVLLYGLLGVLIFSTLKLLFRNEDWDVPIGTLSLMCTVFFISHPIHTEAVANIKGRDEIMSMIGAVSALYSCVKYLDTRQLKYLILGSLALFLGLMSKENAITFLAVIPLAVVLFRRKALPTSILPLVGLLIATFVFLAIRTSILGFDFGGAPKELMNNPFLKWTGSQYVPFTIGEKFASISICLLKYLQLQLAPIHLIHDYYPRSIGVVNFTNITAIIGLVFHLLLIVASVFFWKRAKLVSFGILYYLITLSIVSNVVFPVGTNMSERFVFMPSLGFGIAFIGVLFHYLPKHLAFSFLSILILGFSVRTVVRNTVWYDDYTLFTTDVKQGTRSAKLLNAAGGALVNKASGIQNKSERATLLADAIKHLEEATKIHPTYKNPYLILGNAHYYNENYERSVASLETALQIDPDFADALNNLPIVLRDAGRYYGEKKQDINQALKYLTQSIQLNSEDQETQRLLGISYGMKGDHQNAIKYFKKIADASPQNANAFVNLGIAYKNGGDQENAKIAFDTAVSLDPNALNHLQ